MRAIRFAAALVTLAALLPAHPLAAAPADSTAYADPAHDAAAEPVDTLLTPTDRAFVRLPPDSLADGPIDYLWVVRTSMLSARDIDRLVERAQAARVRGLLVQVVGRGDAYYASTHLPRAEALPPTPAGTTPFDPLGYLLPRAHAVGLEVHAWVNACLVWSSPKPPRDRRHVIHRHPEWISCMADSRPMTRLTSRQRARLGVEGVFVSPAHPGVRAWIAETASEIASNYDVDGIHLDYIRLPAVAVGYESTSRAAFATETGIDPLRFDRVPAARRAAADSAWHAFLSRQVTAVVRQVRDSIERVRPGLPLTAAVLADTITAERHRAQPWRAWLREGLLDRVFLMTYAPRVQTVLEQLLAFGSDLGYTGRVVPGIAVYNTTVSTAAAKIKGARALGYPVLALYSYDALYRRRETWPALRGLLEPATAPPAVR